MNWPYKIGVVVLVLAGVFAGGYWQGRQHGREALLKAAVESYQLRETINHETKNLDPVALCLALCAGWSKPPQINQPVRLVQVEPDLSRWIVSTDKFGIKQRCWK